MESLRDKMSDAFKNLIYFLLGIIFAYIFSFAMIQFYEYFQFWFSSHNPPCKQIGRESSLLRPFCFLCLTSLSSWCSNAVRGGMNRSDVGWRRALSWADLKSSPELWWCAVE
jgi:hypothetical protein